MTTLSEDLFPLITKQCGFYKELSSRNVKWIFEQFKTERMEEDVFIELMEFNQAMEAYATELLRKKLNESKEQ